MILKRSKSKIIAVILAVLPALLVVGGFLFAGINSIYYDLDTEKTMVASLGGLNVSEGEITLSGNTISLTPSGSATITAGAASVWQTTAGDLTLQSMGDLIASSSENLLFVPSGIERMRIASSTGYVGIATTTPYYDLDVLGNVRATAFYGSGANLTGLPTGNDGTWIFSGDTLYSTTAASYVGIGTTSPGTMLDIYGTTTAQNIIPSTSFSFDLGSQGRQWSHLYASSSSFTLLSISATSSLTTTSATMLESETLDTNDIVSVRINNSGDATTTNLYATISHLGTVVEGTWNGAALTDDYIDNNLTIDEGSIDNTAIGQTTASTSVFTDSTSTNLTVSGYSLFNNVNELTVNGPWTWNAAQDINNQTFTNVDIDSGAIDGTAIGANSASTAIFSNATSTNMDIVTLLHAIGALSVEGNTTLTTLTATATSTLATTTITMLEADKLDIGDLYLTNLTVTGTSTLATTTVTQLQASGEVIASSNLYIDGNLGIGTTTPDFQLSVSDGTDELGMYHDGTNAYFKTTDGAFKFETDEGENTHTYVDIRGKGTGTSYLRMYDQDGAEYLRLWSSNGYAVIKADGASPSQVAMQYQGGANVTFFNDLPSGNPTVYVYGYDTGASAKKYGTLNVDSAGAFNILAQSGEELKLGAAGSADITIDTSGNVGINTTGPDRKLDVLDDTNPQLRLTYTSTDVYTDFRATSTGDLVITSNLGQLLRTDSADYNLMVGENAGSNLTQGEGTFNLYVGTEAGEAATSSDYNAFLGYRSGHVNEGGRLNVGLGYATLLNNIGGDYNVAIGSQALYSNTYGNYNFGIGYNALFTNTTGGANVGIGNYVLYYNNGHYNVAIGYQGLSNNTEGYSNVGIGYNALIGNTSGDKNVGIGHGAGSSNQLGDGNVFLGYNAGFYEMRSNTLYIENSDAASSTALIYGEFDNKWVEINDQLRVAQASTTYSSTTNLYVSNTSHLVGPLTVQATSTLATTTITMLEADKLDIGDLYLTNLTVTGTSTLATTTLTQLQASGEAIFSSNAYFNAKVGVGTTTPVGIFEVATTSAASSSFLYVGQDGKIGIGTDSPIAPLTVNSKTNYGQDISVSYNSGISYGLDVSTNLDSTANYTTYGVNVNAYADASGGSSADATAGSFYAQADDVAKGIAASAQSDGGNVYGGWFYAWDIGESDNAYGVYIDADGGANTYGLYVFDDKSYFGGNVGIATTTPATRLDIYGTTTAQNIIPSTSLSFDLGSQGRQWSHLYASSSRFTLLNVSATSTLATTTITMLEADKLDIGDLYLTNLTVTGTSTLATTTVTQLQAAGEAIFSSNAYVSGRVGIGTTTPTKPLEIVGELKMIDEEPGQYVEAVIENTAVDAGAESGGAAGFAFINEQREWKMGVNTYDEFRIRDETGGKNVFGIEDGAQTYMIWLDASGNTGINNHQYPDRALDVLHASNPQLRLTQSDGSVFVDFQADSSGNLIINPSGGLVSMPQASTTLLTVYGTSTLATTSITMLEADKLDIGDLYLTNLTVTGTSTLATTTVTQLQAAGEAIFSSNAYVSGSLGVGTTTSATPLYVIKGIGSAPVAKIINTSGSNGAGLWVETTDGNGIGDALKVVTYQSTNPKTMLRIPNYNYSTGDARVLLAESGGKVGVGTTSPIGIFEVATTSAASSSFLYVGQDGNVGIRSTDPAERLVIGGSSTGGAISINPGFDTAADRTYTYDASTWTQDDENICASSDGLFYVGYSSPFSGVYFDVSTAATYSAGLKTGFYWEYYDGSGWEQIHMFDSSEGFVQDGAITFTPPSDWTSTTLSPDSTARYWVRISTYEGYVNMTSAPVLNTLPTAAKIIKGNAFEIYATNFESSPVFEISRTGSMSIGQMPSDRGKQARLYIDTNGGAAAAGIATPKHYGIYHDISWESRYGNMTGVYNKFSPTGSSEEIYGIGTHNFLNSTTSNDTSYFTNIYNELRGADGSITGLYNVITAEDDSDSLDIRGVYNYLTTYDTDVAYGMYVDDGGSGGTQYGVYLNLNDAGATRYGIYETGGANNYFAGKVGIGTTTPEVKLHVNNALNADNSWQDSYTVLAVEGPDAHMRVISDDTDAWGAAIALDQVDTSEASDFENTWGIARKTNGDGSGDGSLHFTYGTNVNPVSNTSIMMLATSGRVGIGTTSPVGIFEVATSSSASSTFLYVGQDGKVGIGISEPTEMLHIKKDQNDDTGLVIENTSSDVNARPLLKLISDTTTDGIIQFADGPSGYSGAVRYYHSSDLMELSSTGDIRLAASEVGVNVTPEVNFHIASDLATMGDTMKDVSVRLNGEYYESLDSWDRNATIKHNITSVTPTSQLEFDIEDTIIMTLQDDGQVGIGTTSPEARVEIYVGAGGDMTALLIDQDDQDNSALTIESVATTSAIVDIDISPEASSTAILFDIDADGDFVGNFFDIDHGSDDVYTLSTVQGQYDVPVSFNSPGDVSIAYDLVFSNIASSYIKFSGPGYVQTDSASGNYDLTLSAAGTGNVIVKDTFEVANTTTTILYVNHGTQQVGIGTTSPASGYALHVDGDIRATGWTSDGADIAEIYFSDDNLSSGEIVGVQTGGFIKRASSSSNMIGIVSTKPGALLGGEPAQGRYPVALAGKVPVKVSLENGEIKEGDALTLSSIPGVAQKATQAGRIIGFALEEYSSTTLTTSAGLMLSQSTTTPTTTEPAVMVFVNFTWQGNDLSVYSDGETISSTTTESDLALEITESGIVKTRSLQTAKLEVGSPEKPTGITIYDAETGKPFCIIIKSGEFMHLPGKCEEPGTHLLVQQPPTEEPPQSTSTPEASTTTEATATTTEEVSTTTIEAVITESTSTPATTTETITEEVSTTTIETITETSTTTEDNLTQEATTTQEALIEATSTETTYAEIL